MGERRRPAGGPPRPLLMAATACSSTMRYSISQTGLFSTSVGKKSVTCLLDLAKAWEMADTSASNNLAKQLPSSAPYLTARRQISIAFGKWLASSGKKFQTMGQYDDGEFKKISDTMIKIGKLLSKSPVIQAEVQAMKEKRMVKFGELQYKLTAQNAYIDAAVGLVFRYIGGQCWRRLRIMNLQYNGCYTPPPPKC